MAVTATLALEVRPRRDPCTAGLDSDHTSDFQPDLDHTSNESILGSAPSHLYLVTADPSPDLRGAVERLCVDPVLATASPAAAEAAEATWLVDILPHPGVTDAEGDTLAAALAADGFGAVRARTGRRHRLDANLDAKAARCLAERLAHPVVEQVAVYRSDAPPADRWSRAFMPSAATNRTVETVLIVGLDDDALVALSRVRLLALPLEDLRAVQEHFAACGRDPTDVELETIAQTWSEHCAHRTFKATIRHREPGAEEVEIRGLLKTFIVAATETVDRPWVRSAFTDNAGIVAFDRRHDLSFKVETHNHPSAIEPFGGANTGVGGVVRDILGVSADPIANTDILCFGPPGPPPADLPPGALPPDRVRAGVVAGIADYGNKMGIPTVNGAVLFDPGYAANPLVFCGTVGLAPRDANPTLSQPGDLVVTAGGRVGRDGIHGATFSSEVIEAGTTAGLGSVVQIGDPIVEKRLADALPLVRDLGLYSAITDCGAGGLSSAVGEMASELGAEIELSTVPLKYAGLRPWEIWLSEAQERLVFAVPPAHWERFAAVMAAEGVEATAIGRFTGESRLVVRSAGQVVADLDCRFLHAGMPVRQLRSEWSGPPPETLAPPPPIETGADLTPWLERLLVNPNVASKESIVRRYDHEVQGRTVGKPFVGPLDLGPADAAVLRPVATSRRGVAVGCGINPRFGLIDPYAMAMLAVDEALRNVVAVGADPNRTAILDNFCWGDPTQPDRLGGLVRAARGCHDAAVGFRVPFVSGKDSLFNEYRDAAGVSRPIPGTLLISALGIVPDVCRAVSMELKAPGNLLYLVGETADDLGGSLFWHLQGRLGATAPVVRPRAGRALFNALHRTIRAGLVRACHDLSEGGLAVAAAEMAIASGFGVEIDRDLDRTRDRDESPQGFAGESSASAGKLPLSRAPGEGVGGEGSPTATTRPATALGPRRARTGGAAPSDEAWLFAESPTRFLIEVARDDAEAFERSLGRQPTIRIGRVTEEPRLRIHGDAGLVVNADVDDLRRIWREPLMGASA